MATTAKTERSEPISVVNRPVRDVGNGTLGVSVPKEAMRKLGLLDDDGELVEENERISKITVYEDGSIKIETKASAEQSPLGK